ncbi:MAG: class II fructose-bisphosphate aldolase family protein [Bacteroidetes bacterium]|nr:class II fructose-bisphosphate aldolase family protein [Bacteroidota bacterium]
MIVHLKNLLKKAQKNNYALGSFNTHNLETTLGILRAAQAEESPLIISISPNSIRYAGLKPIVHIIETAAKNVVPTIPISFHLDHGENFHEASECIRAGFSSIMIDNSELPFDENIFQTKKVVEYAHRYGVWVQGEIGRVPKTKEEIKLLHEKPEEFLTKPEEAVEFFKKTGVDTLAIGIGNIHGKYKMTHPVKINWSRLREIHKVIKIPLVLHGASGLKKEEIKKAISLGIKIINIHTEINIAFSQALRKKINNDKKEVDPRKILLEPIKAIEEIVKEKIRMFGSSNRTKR